MNKTTFRIAKMDCPSEEQLIRMRLEGLTNIHALKFDIPDRKLIVNHSGPYDQIFQRLASLDFDTTLVETVTTDEIALAGNQQQERKILGYVLGINFFFFGLEILTGFLANSMGLVADSLDMLADSIVYGLSLLAVRRTLQHKKRVAAASGYFQLVLAVLGLGEVVRRFIRSEVTPSFETMIVISLLALIGNAACLVLLQKSRSREAHIQASKIFTSNDVIANVGVIVAGVLVLLTRSRYPDLIIGLAIFFLVGRGAYRILQLSK